MTVGEIHNFDLHNEDIEIIKDFAYLCYPFKGKLQLRNEERLRLGRVAMEELGKITKSKDASLETKDKIIHTLMFLVTMCVCKGWTAKKADGKKWIHLK